MFWDDKYLPLSLYSSEVNRGILHSDEYKEKMKLMQEEYMEDQFQWAKSKGWIVI